MDATKRAAGRRADPDTSDRERTLTALLSVIEDMSLEREEEALVRASLQHLVHAFGSAGITYLLEGGELAPAAELDLDEDDRQPARDMASMALRGSHAVVREALGGGWFAAAPVVSRRRPLGMLVLIQKAAGQPTPDPSLLEALGQQLGTGIENRRLYSDLHASAAQQESLHRVTTALTSGTEFKAVVPEFARELASIQSFDRLLCAFINETGDYIEAFCHPEEASWGMGDVLPVVGSGPGSVVLSGQGVVQRDLLHERRFIEDMRLLEDGLRSCLLLPLTVRSQVSGVLALAAKKPGAYDEDTLARLQPVANSVALALDNVRLFQKTREQSISDELTPLYNARFFHQMLDRELKLVDRYESVLSLVFMDLDRFKPVNDRWGHLRGSRVLREVGFLLRAAVRETDYPVRYGGDEFIVVLPQTDGPAAEQLAGKLRDMIEGHVFLQEEGINVRLGASLGVASYPTDARTKADLVRVADERMYADKASRNTQVE
jgi:diguanylate cyclase (GGDEF)-like protein